LKPRRSRAVDLMKRILTLVIILGLASAAWTLAVRGLTPQGGKTVEIVVRLETVYELARHHGLSVDEILRACHEAGVTTLGVETKSLARMEYAGQVVIVPSSDLAALKDAPDRDALGQASASGGNGDGGHEVFHLAPGPAGDSSLMEWLAEELAVWAPRARVQPGALGPGSLAVHLPAVYKEPPRDQVVSPVEAVSRPDDPLATEETLERDILLGLSPADIELASRHGFLISAFVSNRPGLAPEEALFSLRAVDAGGGDFSTVFFNSPEALGWPDPEALRVVGERVAELGLTLVVKHEQAGTKDVAAAAGWRAIRIQPVWLRSEPDRFPPLARERYEQFMVLEAAFFSGPEVGWLDEVTSGIRDLVRELEAEGLTPGRVRSLTSFTTPPWAVATMAAAIAAASGLALLLVVEPVRSRRWQALLAAAIVAGVLVFALVAGWGPAAEGSGPAILARVVGAFAAAVVFPTIALFMVMRFGLASDGNREAEGSAHLAHLAHRAHRARLARAVAVTILATGVVVAGGVFTAGIGADTTFMLRLNEFRATKLSLVLVPVAGVLLYLGTVGLHSQDGPPSSSGNGRPAALEAMRQIARLLGDRVVVGHVVFLVLLAGAGFVYITRSGDFPLIPVSEAEIAFRHLLQDVLVVRPRTKEFLIGYPALMVLVHWGRCWRAGTVTRWAGLVVTGAASIGLMSVANTYAHLYTPISISLWRTANGLLLGLPLGVAVVAAGEVLAAVYNRLTAGPAPDRGAAGGEGTCP